MWGDEAAISDPDGLRRLADFCRIGVLRTGVQAMTVTWANAFASLELLLATDEVAERVAELEFALGQGPGVDAVESGLPTAADDLESRVSLHRWPLFAVEAVTAGVRAIQAYPIMIDDKALGTVGLYSRAPTRLTSEQHRHATDITELIGLALVDPRAGDSIGSGLRMTVHQAAGMVMQQAGITIEEALMLLRSVAFSEDRQVTHVAADVISGQRRFGEAEVRKGGDGP
ncbi:GAF and ANTAR domain-containing protein [Marmoricola sp. URHA0025 HA25]